MTPRALKGFVLLLLIAAVGMHAEDPANIKALKASNDILRQPNETLMQANDALRQSVPLQSSIEENKIAIVRNSQRAEENRSLIRQGLLELSKQHELQTSTIVRWFTCILISMLSLAAFFVWWHHRHVQSQQTKEFESLSKNIVDAALIAFMNSQKASFERAALDTRLTESIASTDKHVDALNHINDKIKLGKEETEKTIVRIDATTAKTKELVVEMHEKV